MMRRTMLLGMLIASACAPTEPPATMPGPAPGSVTTDPIRRAIQDAGAYFRRPEPNKPAEAARGIANLEFLATNVPSDPRWQAAPAAALTQLVQARNEGRSALDISPSTSPQSVINGLLAAATALDANDRAAVARALPRDVFRAGPEATVQRLARPPMIRSAGAALVSLSAGPSSPR
jgi:hypothetical protein